MSRRLCRGGLGAVIAALLLAGCHHEPPAVTTRPYFREVLSVGQLVQRVNDNNLAIRSIWSRIDYFEAWVADPDTHKVSHIDGNVGHLMYAPPYDLYIDAGNEITQFFQLGSNSKQFWVSQKVDPKTFWYGTYAAMGRHGSRGIPIQPDLLLEVLGVRPLDPSLSRAPVPVMRFCDEQDAYEVVWQFPQSDHWVAQKEIWYDRATLNPRLICIYNRDGRVVVRAELSDFVKGQTQSAAESWSVATRYVLDFPATSTRLELRLRDVADSYHGFPRAGSFVMPNPQTVREKTGAQTIGIDGDNAPQ